MLFSPKIEWLSDSPETSTDKFHLHQRTSSLVSHGSNNKSNLTRQVVISGDFKPCEHGCFITARKRMFLHLSVIQFTGRGCTHTQADSPLDRQPLGKHTPMDKDPRARHPPTRHPPFETATKGGWYASYWNVLLRLLWRHSQIIFSVPFAKF